MKSIDFKSCTHINFDVGNNDINHYFKVSNHVKYSNIRTFQQTFILRIDQKKFFLLKSSKIRYRGQILLVMSTVKKFLVFFMNKNCKKQTKQSLELKSLEKGGELCIKWKSYYTSLKSWIDKKRCHFIKLVNIFVNCIKVLVEMKNRSILFNAFVNCIKVLVEMKNGSILLFFKKS